MWRSQPDKIIRAVFVSYHLCSGLNETVFLILSERMHTGTLYWEKENLGCRLFGPPRRARTQHSILVKYILEIPSSILSVGERATEWQWEIPNDAGLTGMASMG